MTYVFECLVITLELNSGDIDVDFDTHEVDNVASEKEAKEKLLASLNYTSDTSVRKVDSCKFMGSYDYDEWLQGQQESLESQLCNAE